MAHLKVHISELLSKHTHQTAIFNALNLNVTCVIKSHWSAIFLSLTDYLNSQKKKNPTDSWSAPLCGIYIFFQSDVCIIFFPGYLMFCPSCFGSLFRSLMFLWPKINRRNLTLVYTFINKPSTMQVLYISFCLNCKFPRTFSEDIVYLS